MESEESKRRLGMEAVDVSFCAVSESINQMVVSSNQDDVHDSKLESKVEQDVQDYAGGESMIQKASSSDVESEKQHFSPDTNVKNPVGSQNHEESLCLSSSSRVSPKQDDPSTCKVSEKGRSYPEKAYESGQNLPEKVPEDGNEGHRESPCLRTSGDSSDQDDIGTSKVLGNMQTICEEAHESGKSISQTEPGSAFNISETIKNVPKVSESAQNNSDKVLNVPEVSKILHNIPEVSVITLGGDSKRGECFHKEQTKSTLVEIQEKNLKTSNTEQSGKDNPSTLELLPNPEQVCYEIDTSDCRASDCGSKNYPKEQNESASVEKHTNSFTTGTKKCVINVYITWTDNERGENHSLKWSHEDCSVCCGKYDDWKQHVEENHSISMDATGGEEGDVGSERYRSWKKIKTEIPDLNSLVNVSVPCLVNLKSIAQKAQSISNEREIVDENGAEVSLEMNKPAKRPYRRKENTDIPKLRIKLSTNLERSKSHKRRKQSHPSKLKLAGETSPMTKPNYLSETESAGATSVKKGSTTSKVDVSDDLKQEVDDPDFVPPVNTYSSHRLRRKKPMTYTNVKPSHCCSIEGCGMIFKSLAKCNKHEKEDHQGLKYKCRFENCQDKFETKNGRALHERMHKDIFACNQCELVFSNLKDKCLHMRVHASFACGFEDCQKVYTSKKEMLRHRKTHTGERTVKCQHCPKAFFSKKQLNYHKATHRAKILPCDFCDKLFKTKDQLKKHERQHTGMNVLVCQYCGKNLKSRPSLERHERLHTGERPYHCKHCDKRFVCLAMLQNHEQEHTGYQFVCAQCGGKFKTRLYLQEHERIHTGEKPEKCEHCSECFRTKSDLWKHKKLRHSKTKEYKCSICSKAFALRTALNQHQTVHTGERNYECKYCHKKYSSSNVRSCHIKQVHLGIKRTGHQGKAKRLKEEAKQLAEHQNQVEDSGGNVQPKLEGKPLSDQSGDLSKLIGGTKSTFVHSETIPLNLAQDRKHATSGQGSHPPTRDPSRSDFDTMVESIIQFSKEH